jgi:hypothetical protein
MPISRNAFGGVAASAPHGPASYAIMKQFSSNTHENSFVGRLQKRADAKIRHVCKYRYEEAFTIDSENDEIDLRGLTMENKLSYWDTREKDRL